MLQGSRPASAGCFQRSRGSHLSAPTLSARGLSHKPVHLAGERLRRTQNSPLGLASGTVQVIEAKMPVKNVSERKAGQVSMRTLADCKLGVSIYPILEYDASGGGGVAEVTDKGSDRLHLRFDPQTHSIPEVSHKTARFLGVPLLPFFRIAVKSHSLTGWLDKCTGEVELNFVAKFMFTASIFGWVLYAAPPLLVTTRLTTGQVRGQHQGIGGQGSPMDSDGYARLVGVADVPKTGDRFFDAFLRLPGDTLAVMSSHFEI